MKSIFHIFRKKISKGTPRGVKNPQKPQKGGFPPTMSPEPHMGT